ncbi:MAG: ABC transporter permease [Puniceicoccales bacterium]|jgi:oligopeptide transport system permease protein|nr:ABC transporter permease [Puniceicoccales bacterium]
MLNSIVGKHLFVLIFVSKIRITKYILGIIAIGIVLGNTRYSYYQQDIALGATAPSWDHWFGTDRLGRDLFARIIYACCISLSVGFLATLLTVSFGTFYGMISGYYGGKIDLILMRIVDILYPIPLILIVILLMMIFEKHGYVLFLAISIVEWMTTARIIRAEVLKIKESGYIQVARGLGQRKLMILGKHMLPNIAGIIIVCFIITLPNVIILESFLSFLGIGIQPPKSSLGILIAEGAKFMTTSPWQIIFPSTAFVLIMLGLTIYGDRLKK